VLPRVEYFALSKDAEGTRQSISSLVLVFRQPDSSEAIGVELDVWELLRRLPAVLEVHEGPLGSWPAAVSAEAAIGVRSPGKLLRMWRPHQWLPRRMLWLSSMREQ